MVEAAQRAATLMARRRVLWEGDGLRSCWRMLGIMAWGW